MGVPGVEAAEKTEPSGNGHVGRSLKRKEDPRLITGGATYVDDMVLPGMLHAAIVRSPEAHARILSIDTEAAKARPGVEAVFTAEDMADMAAPCPMVWAPPGVEMRVPDHWPLARDKVGYVGQAVAVILAEGVGVDHPSLIGSYSLPGAVVGSRERVGHGERDSVRIEIVGVAVAGVVVAGRSRSPGTW